MLFGLLAVISKQRFELQIDYLGIVKHLKDSLFDTVHEEVAQ